MLAFTRRAVYSDSDMVSDFDCDVEMDVVWESQVSVEVEPGSDVSLKSSKKTSLNKFQRGSVVELHS